MEPILLTTELSEGKRLDAFLAERVEGVSRAAAAKLIEAGAVLADGKPAAAMVRHALLPCSSSGRQL